MANLQLIAGTTDSVTVQLFSDAAETQAIPPTQQWSLASGDPDVVIGAPTGASTFPVTAGTTLKTGIQLSLNSPDIANNPVVILVDVISNTASGTVSTPKPAALAAVAKLG